MGTRERLLETALSVFAERGADGGSMREIARRAGVNVATAYHHFGSKRELFLSIFRELGFIDAPFPLDWEPPKDGKNALELILIGAWAFLRTGESVIRLAVSEGLKGDTDVLAVFAEWQQQGDRELERLLQHVGLATEENAARRAVTFRHVIWGTFIGALLQESIDDEALVAHARDAAAALVEGWQ